MVAGRASRPDGASKYVMAWPASRPALEGGQVGGWPGGRTGPKGRAPSKAGRLICLPHLAGWLARPPCIWAPHHHIQINTQFRKQFEFIVKQFEIVAKQFELFGALTI